MEQIEWIINDGITYGIAEFSSAKYTGLYYSLMEYPIKLKSGKPSAYRKYFLLFTVLQECEICKKNYSPKKCHVRGGLYGWDTNELKDLCENKNLLCTCCWNKIKPIAKKKKIAYENKRLINKLYRETLKNENQNQW